MLIRESGEIGWVYFSENSLSNTTHTFEWRYVKDAYVIDGADRAWVDKVSFDQKNGQVTTIPVKTDFRLRWRWYY